MGAFNLPCNAAPAGICSAKQQAFPPALHMALASFLSAAGVAALLDRLLYTVLGFVVPLYWTVKALLRLFTSAAVPLRADALVPGAEDNATVPDDFPGLSPITLSAALEKGAGAPFSASAGSLAGTAAQTVVTNWLHYWCVLAGVHLLVALYGLLVAPFFGYSLLVRVAKLALIGWLATGPDAEAARWMWTSFVAPVAAKHEADLDALVAWAASQSRAHALSATARTRALFSKKVKTA